MEYFWKISKESYSCFKLCLFLNIFFIICMLFQNTIIIDVFHDPQFDGSLFRQKYINLFLTFDLSFVVEWGRLSEYIDGLLYRWIELSIFMFFVWMNPLVSFSRQLCGWSLRVPGRSQRRSIDLTPLYEMRRCWTMECCVKRCVIY